MMPRSDQTFRAAMSSYLILGGIFGGMFAFTLYATFFTHSSFWKAAVSFGAAFLLVVLWLAVFEIRIADDELSLRSLFGGVKRIKYNEIGKVRLGFDLRSHGGPLRLFVERKDSGAPPLSINAKVFSRDAILAVLDLGERVSTTDAVELEEGIAMRVIRKRRRKTRVNDDAV